MFHFTFDNHYLFLLVVLRALNSYISLADRARPGSGARGLPSRHVDVGQRNRKRSLPFGQRTTPPDSSTPLRWGRACSHCCMGLTTLLPTMPLSWDWTGFSGTSGRVRSYEPQIIGRLTCVPVAVEVAVPRCLFTRGTLSAGLVLCLYSRDMKK